jgi:uncharacterized protein (DUF169 family)
VFSQAAQGASFQVPDEEIVARVRARATALFEVLMRRHNQKPLPRDPRGLRQEADVDAIMQRARRGGAGVVARRAPARCAAARIIGPARAPGDHAYLKSEPSTLAAEAPPD